MAKRIIFISDFFINEIVGGAEFCNDALINLLKKKIKVDSIKSSQVTTSFIESNKECFFIIANFFHLTHEVINTLISQCQYAILEHDHKYSRMNNPSKFINFVIPEDHIINKSFYAAARAVLCQSQIHAEVVQKNLFLSNICCLGGNIWTEQQLEILESNIGAQKTVDHGIMHTYNKNKGMPKAINYCEENNLKYEFLYNKPYGEFIKDLAKVEKLVFFPQWLESYCRVAIEAKILGCKLITNGLLGAATESYFSQNGKTLLKTIRENNEDIYNKWLQIIENKNIEYLPPINIPKITISCSVYDGDKYIKSFLEDITKQTIFDSCELIIVNANSPGNEEEIINEYCKKFDNIIYKRLDYRATTTEVINMVINDLSSGEFITFGCVDDRRNHNCLEIQAKHLMFNNNISLVYGDCLQTTVSNETFEKNSSKNKLYEHSLNKFSKENMIKCLPGPIPMWRLKVHKEVGLFKEKYNFANDWDMWLRMVDAGLKFKKISCPLGLYYFNPDGRSTSVNNFKNKIKEEAELFLKFKHIFGERNFNKYKNHFLQGAPNE